MYPIFFLIRKERIMRKKTMADVEMAREARLWITGVLIPIGVVLYTYYSNQNQAEEGKPIKQGFFQRILTNRSRRKLGL